MSVHGRVSHRGPVAHIVRVPLTQEEHEELHAIVKFERSTYAETSRRAIRDYIDKRTSR